ncbi:MAG TPA: hypothetical protein VFH61_11595 [Thermoleophilia bacterium]|nr:hypothetical protein [Thermoleophilia bacterium]
MVWEISDELASEIVTYEHEWWNGDRARARVIAEEIVARHPSAFDVLRPLSLEDCVKALDACRGECAWSDGKIKKFPQREPLINVWLLATFPPQNISGSMGTTPAQVLQAAADALTE